MAARGTTGSVGWVGQVFVADVGESVEGGLELGFLLGPSPGGREAMLADLRRDLEALVVVRPLLVEDEVARGAAVLALGDGLELDLEFAPTASLATRSISGPR